MRWFVPNEPLRASGTNAFLCRRQPSPTDREGFPDDRHEQGDHRAGLRELRGRRRPRRPRRLRRRHPVGRARRLPASPAPTSAPRPCSKASSCVSDEIGDHFAVVPEQFVADGDTVVALGHLSWKHKDTGAPASVKMAHVWTSRRQGRHVPAAHRHRQGPRAELIAPAARHQRGITRTAFDGSWRRRRDPWFPVAMEKTAGERHPRLKNPA